MRILVLCTHNSARSQMAEGWLRHHAAERGLSVEVVSAGTERSSVKPDAITVMAEVGIDLRSHTSKRLDEIADPWGFDLVLTVCDAANETCPAYPAQTARRHVPFADPSGQPLERWREVRDQIERLSRVVMRELSRGAVPDQASLHAAHEQRV